VFRGQPWEWSVFADLYWGIEWEWFNAHWDKYLFWWNERGEWDAFSGESEWVRDWGGVIGGGDDLSAD